jgi:hypothetical protein
MRLPTWHGRQRHQCECAEAVAAALPCYTPLGTGLGFSPIFIYFDVRSLYGAYIHRVFVSVQRPIWTPRCPS